MYDSSSPMRQKRARGLIYLCLPLLLLSGLFSGCEGRDRENSAAIPAEGSVSTIHFWEATDLHYLDKSLHDGGTAFQSFVASGDGKQLPYIDEILNAFVHEAEIKKPDFIILSGDLTNNGERASHKSLARKLARIEEKGSSVYVIPGNHDLFNPWARAFKGDRQMVTDRITDKDFTDIYGRFGYDEALSRDPHSLSYAVRAAPGLWLLMIDSNQYNHNQRLGHPQTDGRVLSSTLAWIDSCLQQAAEENAAVLTVMHHNVLDHSDLNIPGFKVNNSGQVMKKLREHRLNLVLSGHIHMQDIRRNLANGGSEFPDRTAVYDIATSALAVNPHQYGAMTFDPLTGRTTYQSTPVNVDGWAASEGLTDSRLLSFKKYAEQSFIDASYKKAYESLAGSEFSSQNKQEMAEAMARLNARYFAGTAGSGIDDLLKLPGFKLWSTVKDGFLPRYIRSMTQPKPLSNTSLEITLNREQP
ncbi:3',5'-cyclic AMP phosphodiesterase CpdA [Paenibacillus forsythiae]|uniref:3',5'-cyclic AMP phosphodiesterase CpdA n=1 Tax=Paenibacillus forsythiae TaxID=365616 RepID=A0ABU3H465_9BACL|nr:metallophosphoesterase [Paenibacillus forsythiae]MDT3425609.1 3',5'-cyclic AMP phosphodiesterase CpdA [Paenibacillus forsythiae]